jgi:two-component system chemotaxis response regulator CheB
MTVTRVVVTDDSQIARALLCDVINGRPELRVVAQASSVEELETALLRTNPHVVTLDLLMPGKAGLSIIRALAERTAVVVVSDAKSDSPLAKESLAQGASAFVPKRSLATPAGRAELLRLLLRAPVSHKPEFVVAIAGSTGAMPALEAFAGELGRLEAAVAVVQHLPSERMAAFADWLTELGLPANVAEQPMPLTRGRAVVAPGHHHMTVVRAERAELDASPPVAGHTPSADYLFRSLVREASQTIAVVLSGMGRDGAAGIAPLVAAGATCFVQRPDTCPVPAMPLAAQEAARGRAIPLPAHDIGLAIRGLLAGRRSG